MAEEFKVAALWHRHCNKDFQAGSLGLCLATSHHPTSLMFIYYFSLLIVVYMSKPNEQYSIFTLLHFSALFSTVDLIFLNLTGLPWNHPSFLLFHLSCISVPFDSSWNVEASQGSILRPLFFISTYILSLSDLIQASGFKYYLHANGCSHLDIQSWPVHWAASRLLEKSHVNSESESQI